MWIFRKPPDALTEEDLQQLVEARVRESVTVEFKGEMYRRRDPQASLEMLRDVSSIANAEGGVLIIGIEEDGEGTAVGLRPVPDAEAEANRLIASCHANIAERIPALRAPRVPMAGGNAIVVVIPRSYRKPHMVTANGATEFWIRHDRQKSRMSIAEIRTAITTTEDLEMRAERFIALRRQAASAGINHMLFVLMGTPLLIEDGRVDMSDRRIAELLRNPPTFRPGSGARLSHPGATVEPTMHGLRAVDHEIRMLHVFRNAHLEFALLRPDVLLDGRHEGLLKPWAVAELFRNFLHLLDQVRQLAAITDPYVITVSVWYCQGVRMSERGLDRWGEGNIRQFDETGRDLFLDPIIAATDEDPDITTRRVADRFWNAFYFTGCPFFDADGRFRIPE
jgi:Putative DNA-binding domain